MFKQVEYVGFENHPELRAMAERATPILADEIRTFRDEVAVEWECHFEEPSAIELTLTLQLPIGSATTSRYLDQTDFQDDEEFRSCCRKVWWNLLDQIVDQRRVIWDEIIHQTVEV